MNPRLDPRDFNFVTYATGKLIMSIIQVVSETRKRTWALTVWCRFAPSAMNIPDSFFLQGWLAISNRDFGYNLLSFLEDRHNFSVLRDDFLSPQIAG